MFGQWALGTSPIGEPEELPSTAAQATAYVEIVQSTLCDVEIEASDITMDVFQ